MALGIKGQNRRELLRGVSLFSVCSDRELDSVATITTPIAAEAGQVLTWEGETGSEFFVVVDGTATASIGDRRVADLGPGSFFGELALLDGGPRTATVTASSPMNLLVLNRGEFCQLIESSIPSVARKMLKAIGTRLRTMDEALA
jgi:CRP-like cAMP-binding protein